MDITYYMQRLAAQLAAPMAANSAIKEFTTNSDVIGAYAEATVVEFVKKMVEPARVCSGTIVAPDIDPQKTPQLDCIVWHPGPFPAIFEVGSFGIVPRSSVDGVLEIKRSNYSGVGAALDSFFSNTESLIEPSMKERVRNKMRHSLYDYEFNSSKLLTSSSISEELRTLPTRLEPKGKVEDNEPRRRLAVICLFDAAHSDAKLEERLKIGDAVAVLNVDEYGNVSANNPGIMGLVAYLVGLRGHIQTNDGTRLPNMSYLGEL